jgi:hypothetical protein
MPRVPGENAVQIAMRVPPAWLDEADKLSRHKSQRGATFTRTDALRIALGIGLSSMGADETYFEQRRGDPARLGPWKIDPKTLVIEHDGAKHYGVDMEEMTDSAGTLDWIMQLAKKTWISAADLGILVRLIDQVLEPQAGMCSMGVDGTIDPVQRVAHSLGVPAARAKKRTRP